MILWKFLINDLGGVLENISVSTFAVLQLKEKIRAKCTLRLKHNYAFFESKSLLLLLLFLLVELIITKILDLFPPVFFSEFCGLCRRLKLQFYVNNSASAESHNKKTWSMTLRGKTVGKTSGTQEDKRKKKKGTWLNIHCMACYCPSAVAELRKPSHPSLPFAYTHIYIQIIYYIYTILIASSIKDIMWIQEHEYHTAWYPVPQLWLSQSLPCGILLRKYIPGICVPEVYWVFWFAPPE